MFGEVGPRLKDLVERAFGTKAETAAAGVPSLSCFIFFSPLLRVHAFEASPQDISEVTNPERACNTSLQLLSTLP
jgi:hypothetical protein